MAPNPPRAPLRLLSWAVVSFALAACVPTHFEQGGVRYVIDRSACCSLPEGAPSGAEACAARGCVWQQEPLCMGTDWPSDEAAREHGERVARCEIACACVCPADRDACRHAQ